MGIDEGEQTIAAVHDRERENQPEPHKQGNSGYSEDVPHGGVRSLYKLTAELRTSGTCIPVQEGYFTEEDRPGEARRKQRRIDCVAAWAYDAGRRAAA